jgi:hypothetical protein
MVGRNKATPSATTLDVVEIAPHERASNNLGRNQSSGSNLLGKNASIVAQLPCFWQGVEIATSANTLGVVDIAPYASPSNKLGINQSNGSILSGKNANIVAQLPCLRQGVEIAPCNDSGRSQHSSVCEPIQQLRYKPIEWIDLVGKDAIIIANDHQRSWREVDKAWSWL